jgi:natural product biosynthesis luciferase-like monooxygenase protein
VDFSLFYFADNTGHADGYRMLLDGARFADRHGFTAVWTPERHFHPFGGDYPNPAVTGAAVAAVTDRVGIRAGSVVAPLHPPVRIAEDWAVVDNLSGGRVGISFTSGWHAADFAIRPQNYAGRRDVLAETVDTVRRLWRREEVELTDGAGDQVRVRTYPAPVRPELPVWLTCSGRTSTSSPARSPPTARHWPPSTATRPVAATSRSCCTRSSAATARR